MNTVKLTLWKQSDGFYVKAGGSYAPTNYGKRENKK